MKMMDLAPQASPVFPQAVYSRAEVSNEPGTGYLLASQASSRQFFCPADDSHVQQTQFSGSVSRVYEIESQDAREDEDLEEVLFGGKLLRYCLSRPLALKTCRIAVLKLEAQWQRCAMGELVGEDPVKEVASLQLLQGGQAGGGGHDGVEELIEAMADDTTLYKISPWYSGGELFDYAPLPEDAAKSVFTQILDAVAFVHRQGVCHRDISLENILMDTSTSAVSSSRTRECSSRSSSVSSIGSCMSVSSEDTEPDSFAHGSHSGGGGCCVDFSGLSSPCGSSSTAERRKRAEMEAGAEWLGTPRLCDFGMSVRIPTSPSGGKAPLTPQGRCGKSTCVAPEVFYDQAFDPHAIDTWSVGTTLFMALLGVQPWEEIGDFKFQAIAEGKNLDVVLQGWKLRDAISDEAVDLLQAMLTADPEERLSDIDSILSHPWFQSSSSNSNSFSARSK